MHAMEWISTLFVLITAGLASVVAPAPDSVIRHEPLPAYRVESQVLGATEQAAQNWQVHVVVEPVAQDLVRVHGTIGHIEPSPRPRSVFTRVDIFARPDQGYVVAVGALDGGRRLQLTARRPY